MILTPQRRQERSTNTGPRVQWCSALQMRISGTIRVTSSSWGPSSKRVRC